MAVRLLAVISLVLPLLLIAYAHDELKPKKLAGSPSEFELHRIPSTTNGAEVEHSCLFEISLSEQTQTPVGTPAWEGELVVDSDEEFRFMILSPIESLLSITLIDAAGHIKDIHEFGTRATFPLDDTGEGADGTVYIFRKPVIGVWTCQLHWISNSTASLSTSEDKRDKVVLIVYNESHLKVESKLTTYNLITGSRVGISSKVDNTGIETNSDTIVAISNADLLVTFPNGKTVNVPMNDDGILGDQRASDNEYTGTMIAHTAGMYRMQAILCGTRDDGRKFKRTTQQIFAVSGNSERLSGAAFTFVKKNSRRIPIFVKVSQSIESTVRIHAELFGTTVGATPGITKVPVAWIGGLVNISTTINGSHYAFLELDAAWLARAHAAEPIELRNAYIQDVNTQVPISRLPLIKISVQGEISLQRLVHMLGMEWGEMAQPITSIMRNGYRPSRYHGIGHNSTSSAYNKLVLVHGYCSSSNPFQSDQESFTEAAFFLNKKANVNNDQFAQLIASFAKDFPAYSLIGHSQGGLAITHLHNFYWSGADYFQSSSQELGRPTINSKNSRILQSVGSPFLGNSIAGTAALIGKIFGVGCGPNTDLTRDGAQLWAAGITTNTREQLFIYSTVYPPGFLKTCSLGANLVLKKPNDGVAELSFTLLHNANDCGVKEGWCHSANLLFPSQCQDSERNQEMDLKAKRT